MSKASDVTNKKYHREYIIDSDGEIIGEYSSDEYNSDDDLEK